MTTHAVSNEFTKIVKSKQFLVAIIITLLYPAGIIIFIKYRGYADRSALDITTYIIRSMVDSFEVSFITAMLAGLLFAGEFQFNTLRYILIRPISIGRFVVGKVVALWLTVCALYGGIILVCLGANSFLWDFAPLHSKNMIAHPRGIYVLAMLLAATCVILLFYIAVTSLLSVILRNQINVVVTAMILFFLLLFLANFKLLDSVIPLYMNSNFIDPLFEKPDSLSIVVPKMAVLIGESAALIGLTILIMKRSTLDE